MAFLKDFSLKSMDFFGRPIQLNYDKKRRYKTYFGAVVTMFAIFFMITVFSTQMADYINSTTIAAYSNRDMSDNPDEMVVGKDTIMFAVKIQQDLFITNPYYNITLSSNTYLTDSQGVKTKVRKYFPMEQCRIDHFDDLPKTNQNWTRLFENNALSDYLCPRKQDFFKIRGVYANQEFSFLRFQLTHCVNQTEIASTSPANLLWKPICKSNEELEQIALDSSMRFQMLLTTNNINPQQTKDYLNEYISEDINFIIKPNLSYTTADIFISKHTLKTDVGITPIKEYETEEFAVYEQNNYKYQQVAGDFPIFGEFYIRRSPFSVVSMRSFYKISAFLSYLGGFSQTILVIGYLLTFVYNNASFNIELANSLYYITEEKGFQTFLEVQREKQEINKKLNRSSLKDVDSEFANSPQQDLYRNSNDLQQLPFQETAQASPNFKMSPIEPQISTKRYNSQLTQPGRSEQHPPWNHNMNVPSEQVRQKSNEQNNQSGPQSELDQNATFNADVEQKQPSFQRTIASSLFSKAKLKQDENDGESKNQLYQQNQQPSQQEKPDQVIEVAPDNPLTLSQSSNEKPQEEVVYSQIKEKHIRMSMSYILNKLSFGLLCKSHDVNLIRFAEQKVSEDMDILNILLKIQEFDKMKEIIFTKSQQTLFAEIPKPKVSFQKYILLKKAKSRAKDTEYLKRIKEDLILNSFSVLRLQDTSKKSKKIIRMLEEKMWMREVKKSNDADKPSNYFQNYYRAMNSNKIIDYFDSKQIPKKNQAALTLNPQRNSGELSIQDNCCIFETENRLNKYTSEENNITAVTNNQPVYINFKTTQEREELNGNDRECKIRDSEQDKSLIPQEKEFEMIKSPIDTVREQFEIEGNDTLSNVKVNQNDFNDKDEDDNNHFGDQARDEQRNGNQLRTMNFKQLSGNTKKIDSPVNGQTGGINNYNFKNRRISEE